MSRLVELVRKGKVGGDRVRQEAGDALEEAVTLVNEALHPVFADRVVGRLRAACEAAYARGLAEGLEAKKGGLGSDSAGFLAKKGED